MNWGTFMLRIGICDDQADARDALRFQLEKVLVEGAEEIVYEFSSGSGAVRWLKNHPCQIDLLFLDVEMDGISGMEAAEQIRTFDTDLIIVFVTGFADYVFEGYRVSAFDYIMKPLGTERIRDLLKRVRIELFENRNLYYTMKNTDGTYRFPLSEIDYFYSDKRKVILVSRGSEYPFYGKLDEVERELCDNFVRIHQRYLVNAGKVEHIGVNHVKLGEKTLPVSRALKEKAVARLAKELLGGLA